MIAGIFKVIRGLQNVLIESNKISDLMHWRLLSKVEVTVTRRVNDQVFSVVKIDRIQKSKKP